MALVSTLMAHFWTCVVMGIFPPSRSGTWVSVFLADFSHLLHQTNHHWGLWSLSHLLCQSFYGSVSLFGEYASQPFWFCLESQILCLNMLGFIPVVSSKSPQHLLFLPSLPCSSQVITKTLHWSHCRFMLALISPRSYFSVKKKSIFYEIPAAFL